MATSSLLQSTLGKRRAIDDDPGDEDNTLFIPEEPLDSTYSDVTDGRLDEQPNDNSDFDEDATSEPEEDFYSEQRELLPSCAAYDPAFEDISERVVKLALKARVKLDAHDCNSENVQRLRDRAAAVSTVPTPKSTMIGLLGNAGEGKSSLLNSIIDIPNLAKAIDVGSSCTYVVTLYHQAPASQNSKFAAKVEYFDLETIGKMLAECLDDWVAWTKGDQTGWSAETKKLAERRADTCLSTFRAVFCDYASFKIRETSIMALNQIVNDGFNRQDQINGYVEAAARHLGTKEQPDGKYIDYFEAETQEDLREQIDPLLVESTRYENATLWPFVKTVSIGVKGSRLLKQYTVVDLPGVSDTNQVRVKSTYEYVDQCDEIWIVCRSGRIITDDTVDGLLQRYGQSTRGHVAVIATSSDANIDHDLAIDLRARGYNMGDYDTLQKLGSSLRKTLVSLKKKLPRSKGLEKQDLRERISEHVDQLTMIDAQQDSIIVSVRNQHIIASLRRDKEKHLPKGKTLNVFCVSNTHYSAHKNVPNKINGHLLDIAITGIPRLRAFALQLAAPKLIRSLEDFIKSDFDIFFTGLEMWANQRLIEGRNELLGIARMPLDAAANILPEISLQLAKLVENNLIHPFHLHRDEYVFQAIEHVERVNNWHWSTIRAFMRKYGKHKTPAMPLPDGGSWNMNFTQAPSTVIRELWNDFVESLNSLEKDIKMALEECILQVPKIVKNHPRAMSLDIPAFDQSIEAHTRGMQQHVRNCFENFIGDLRVIFDKGTQDREDGYFYGAVAPCYDECTADSGQGVKGRSLGRFRTRFMQPGPQSPFYILGNSIQTAITEAAQNRVVTLAQQLQVTLSGLVDNIDLMLTRSANDPTEMPVRAAINEFLAESTPAVNKIRSDFEELKQAYQN